MFCSRVKKTVFSKKEEMSKRVAGKFARTYKIALGGKIA